MKMTKELKEYIIAQVSCVAMKKSKEGIKDLNKKYHTKIKELKKYKNDIEKLRTKKLYLEDYINKAEPNCRFCAYDLTFINSGTFNIREKSNELILKIEYAESSDNIIEQIAKLIKEL